MPFYCLNNISAALKFLAASHWATLPPTSRRQPLGHPAANVTPPGRLPPTSRRQAAGPSTSHILYIYWPYVYLIILTSKIR
jgi:hypothetical protein